MDVSNVEQYYDLKLQEFQRSDEERQALIGTLLRQCAEFQKLYRRNCDDYENEVESRRMWQQKENTARNEVKQLRYATVSETLLLSLHVILPRHVTSSRCCLQKPLRRLQLFVCTGIPP